MDGGKARRTLLRHGGGDEGTPVAALRHIALITQTLHQGAPGTRRALAIPAARRRLVGKTETWKRRDDDVESISRRSTMGGRIGQRCDDFTKQQNGAGPAMRQNDR